jgi:hypothetical protein
LKMKILHPFEPGLRMTNKMWCRAAIVRQHLKNIYNYFEE